MRKPQDRTMIKNVITLMIPIMIQNGITNFVNMLDNVMVGQIGTLEMTGVSVANTLFFVFNLCIFGAVSGVGIFSSQFYGKGDTEGVRQTFRYKLLFCLGLTVLAIAVFVIAGTSLIRAYLQGDGTPADLQASFNFGKQYLTIMLFGLVPYAIVQCYSGTLRETDHAVLPMVAGVSAVLVNLVLNYVLIFGHFGAPKLGVAGAAIATAISRFVELAIVMVWTHTHTEKVPFAEHLYQTMRVPLYLVKDITVKGMPLLINETLWAAGTAMLTQCYSVRGLSVVSASNISSTFWNVFSVAFLSVGVAIGILLGQLLGAGNTEKAKSTSMQLIVFSIVVSVVVGGLYYWVAPYIPLAYQTTGEVRTLATEMMRITAVAMPIEAVANACYFTLRSGGKTLITFLFDSCFVWVVNVSTAYLISRFTSLPILPLFAIVQFEGLLKDAIGFVMVKQGAWVRTIVNHE